MLDPQAKQFLDTLDSLNMPPYEVIGPTEARAASAATAKLIGPPLPVAETRDLAAPRPGGEISLRLYRPQGGGPQQPALVYLHGGGWVLGDIPTHARLATEIVHGAGCAVILVEYRLAPENKFPAAADDAFAALQWTLDHAADLGLDPNRIAIGGDSAGANLAAAACLMAKDRNALMPLAQILIYPVVDCDFDRPSYRDNANGYLLTRDSMKWFWQCYVATESDMLHPYASPLRAKDLSGLPQALVITAEYDPLRDEGEAYARRLAEAGVPATLTRYEGMIHAFIRRTDIFDQAHKAQQEVCRTLREVFADNS